VGSTVESAEGWLVDRRNAQPVYPNLPFVFWQHPVNVTIPNDAWTPLPWNTVRAQGGSALWSTYRPASTTIAVGSDSAALPQATINVASTADFLTSGYLVIRIGGTDRVVRYTGKNATQFTGCTLGVGTMATGDAVAQAQVTFGVASTIGPAIAEVAWASSAVGLRGIRLRFMDGSLNLAGASTVVGAVAATNPLMHVQTAEQPANNPTAFPIAGLTGNVIEAYQSSGGNLDSVATGQLDAPRLVGQALSGFPVAFW
jgi:hypothetical protein